MVSLTKKYLLQDRARLAISVSGVSLAMLLIFTLSGIYLGFYRQATIYIENTGADLWVVQKGASNFYFSLSLLPSNLEQEIARIDGVQSVSPLIAYSAFLQKGSNSQWVFYFGYNKTTGTGGPWDISQGKGIESPNEIVIDRSIALKNGIGLGDRVSLQGEDFTVAGISSGTSGIVAPYAFITIADAERISGLGSLVSYFLVKVSPGASSQVSSSILASFINVDVFSTSEWAIASRDFLLAGPLPIIQAMAIMGGLVGVLVVGLTNYTATVERTKEYGVLKALGIKNRGLYRLVVTQSIVVALCGFIVGGLLTVVAVAGLTQLVQYSLPLVYDQYSIGSILVVALLMGLGAALLPVRRLAGIDPAIAFK